MSGVAWIILPPVMPIVSTHDQTKPRVLAAVRRASNCAC
jgi:hypothetical protein